MCSTSSLSVPPEVRYCSHRCQPIAITIDQFEEFICCELTEYRNTVFVFSLYEFITWCGMFRRAKFDSESIHVPPSQMVDTILYQGQVGDIA